MRKKNGMSLRGLNKGQTKPKRATWLRIKNDEWNYNDVKKKSRKICSKCPVDSWTYTYYTEGIKNEEAALLPARLVPLTPGKINLKDIQSWTMRPAFKVVAVVVSIPVVSSFRRIPNCTRLFYNSTPSLLSSSCSFRAVLWDNHPSR